MPGRYGQRACRRPGGSALSGGRVAALSHRHGPRSPALRPGASAPFPAGGYPAAVGAMGQPAAPVAALGGDHADRAGQRGDQRRAGAVPLPHVQRLPARLSAAGNQRHDTPRSEARAMAPSLRPTPAASEGGPGEAAAADPVPGEPRSPGSSPATSTPAPTTSASISSPRRAPTRCPPTARWPRRWDCRDQHGADLPVGQRPPANPVSKSSEQHNPASSAPGAARRTPIESRTPPLESSKPGGCRGKGDRTAHSGLPAQGPLLSEG
jgi:hypothetical protein